MAYIERRDEEIIEAWEEYLENSDETQECACGSHLISNLQVFRKLKDEDPEAVRTIVESIKLFADQADMDPLEWISDQAEDGEKQ